jgi:hypothetical protein
MIAIRAEDDRNTMFAAFEVNSMPSLCLSRSLLAFVSFCFYNLPSGLAQEPYQIKFRLGYANIRPNVRGSLGEGFFQNFDLFLENRRHLIQFESGTRQLADMLSGEHMPLSLNGSYEHEPTRNRLVVIANIPGKHL